MTMKEIQMVDLKSQYLRMKTAIDEAISNVLMSASFINGPEVKLFQENLQKYLNVKHVIPCANGTDALQIALMALDLKPGDEVITSNFTFIATVEVIALLGLRPILVDVLPDTFCIDTAAIEALITPKTKAIIPVHLFGQSADMEPLMDIAQRYNLFVIEDTAQALGTDYIFSNGKKVKAGTIGHVGCTSFFPSKNLGCFGDGGAMFTNDDQIAEKLRMIANHGSKIKYHHTVLGVNSRLDTLQAAILNVKLKYLDTFNQARQKAAEYYTHELAHYDGIRLPLFDSSKTTHIFHQYTLVCEGMDRDELKKYLESKGIPSMVYYPVPFHRQDAFKELIYKEWDFPITEHLCKTVLSLPMHTELDEEQLGYIVDSIKSKK